MVLEKPFYHALLALPDGNLYQTLAQARTYAKEHPINLIKAGNRLVNNFCFRDPQFFKDPATQKAYLLFEANTGAGCCAEASVSRDYIGGAGYDPLFAASADDARANGCIGIAEFTNGDYHTLNYLPPLLTTNLVTDEIERPNLVTYQGRYYLFCVTRSHNMTVASKDSAVSVFMLGFCADNLFGPYTPMNDSGVVIRQRHGAGGEGSHPQNVYSFITLPDLTVLTYANYCNSGTGDVQKLRTAGPSVRLAISGTTSRIASIAYSVLAK